jgi:DNA-binding LacI/PurR family transcriptional regulator
VLSGRGNVGAAHRRRVLEAVEDLGYRPNRLAQNLRRQRTATIGVIVSDIENRTSARWCARSRTRLYRQGHRVLVCNTDESPEKQHAYLQTLVGERVVGVVLSPSDPAGPEIPEL